MIKKLAIVYQRSKDNRATITCQLQEYIGIMSVSAKFYTHAVFFYPS
jgi:hypothetical protein